MYLGKVTVTASQAIPIEDERYQAVRTKASALLQLGNLISLITHKHLTGQSAAVRCFHILYISTYNMLRARKSLPAPAACASFAARGEGETKLTAEAVAGEELRRAAVRRGDLPHKAKPRAVRRASVLLKRRARSVHRRRGRRTAAFDPYGEGIPLRLRAEADMAVRRSVDDAV